MVFIHLDSDVSNSPAPPAPSNKRKLPLFNTTGKRSRLSSLLSLSSSRKSSPTCTISLECATTNVPSIDLNMDSDCALAVPSPSSSDVDVIAIPFPTCSSDCESDSDLDACQLDAAVKVRRRSMQATPRSSLSQEQRTRKESLERSRKDPLERTRKSSLATTKRKPTRRQLVHHSLLAPASRAPPPLPSRPRKRQPHMKQSDLRFLASVLKSVSSSLDERMVDFESDLQEQDRLFVHRLGEMLAERGVREGDDPVSSLTPSQIVATSTLRRRDLAAVRSTKLASSPKAPERRRSPLACS